jgi:DNA-binding transcriptional regulator YhcF (GntR family)
LLAYFRPSQGELGILQENSGVHRVETPLTARDVQEALEERISKGLYALGQRLPPVRSIAAEFGTSPSTVSRALQEMMRDGWLEVQERQFVRVRKQLAPKEMRAADLRQVIKSVAYKWKLRGGTQAELIETVHELVDEVFDCDANLVFAECNKHDLNFMAEQLEKELSAVPIARVLIQDLDKSKLRRSNSVVLVPYYHYAEVKECVGETISIVPVHSSPSVETLDKLLTIPPGSNVLVVGHNGRSVTRLSGMVQDYVEAKVTGITLSERTKLGKLAPAADVVVAVRSGVDKLAKIGPIRRLIVVRFVLETSLSDRLKSATRNNGAGSSGDFTRK